jgi:hypothetical protein
MYKVIKQTCGLVGILDERNDTKVCEQIQGLIQKIPD